MKISLIIYFTLTSFVCFSQTKKSEYVEGAGIVLEFAKLFKGDGSGSDKNDCKDLMIGDIEIINKVDSKLTVTILEKESKEELYQLVVNKKQKEFLYEIPADVYQCLVMKYASKEIIKQGDINLKACKTLKITIKE